MKVSDIKLGAKINALIKGEPGGGKTFIEGSFPKPIYIFDLDHKVDVLKKMEMVLGKDVFSTEGIDYDTYGAMDYPAFRLKILEFEKDSDSGYLQYKTVCVDSLTTLADMLIRYSLSMRGPERKAEDKNAKERKRGVIEMPEFEEFNVESLAINQLIDIGRNLKAHFLLTAHVLRTSDSKGRETRTLMTAGKKIATAIPAKFKEQWLVEVDTGLSSDDTPTYLVRTRPTASDSASSLLPLPNVIDFTNKPFYPIIEGLLREKGIELSEKAKELTEEELKERGEAL